MIALPPVDVGVVYVTEMVCEPVRVAVLIVGAVAVVYGVTVADRAEMVPQPAALNASTLNVYEVAAVRPVKIMEVALDPTTLVVKPVTPPAAAPANPNTVTR